MAHKNNVKMQLEAGIDGDMSANSLIVQTSKKNLLPSGAQSTRATLVSYDTSGNVVKREIVLITARTSDSNIVTITRGYEDCPQSDTAGTADNLPLEFSEGDWLYLGMTAGWQDSIEADILALQNEKMGIDDYISGALLFSKSNTGNDSYTATMTEVDSYAEIDGQAVRVRVDTGNTNAATLNINGLGAKNITKWGGSTLDTGDIPAGIVMVVEWNNDEDRFELVNTIDQSSGAETGALTESTNFVIGEDIASGKSMFATSRATFAESTRVQKIGDDNKRKRISYAEFGSGVAGTTLKAALRKYATPGVDLKLRIETDNAGAPSGTLVHANATATVTAASLTTSLVDTTVTLAGSITITKGQKVHLVWFAGTYGSETVSSTNYFGIGVKDSELSSVRNSCKYNSSWTSNPHTDYNNQTWLLDTSSGNSYGFIITPKIDGEIIKVGRAPGCAGTRCRVWLAAGTVLMDTSTTLVGEEFIFSGASTAVSAGVNYIVEIDASGGSFALPYVSSFVSVSDTYLTWVQGTQNTSGQPNAYNIESITLVPHADKPYSSSALFDQTVLAMTNARYPRTLPTDIRARVATETKTVGNLIASTTYGINSNQSGLTPFSVNKLPLYLSDTYGGVSNTAGTYKFRIGRAITASKMFVDPKPLHKIIIPVTSSAMVYQNTTGQSMQIVVLGGTVNPIAVSKDNVTYMTKHTATNNEVIINPGDYVKITYTVAPTSVTAYMI